MQQSVVCHRSDWLIKMQVNYKLLNNSVRTAWGLWSHSPAYPPSPSAPSCRWSWRPPAGWGTHDSRPVEPLRMHRWKILKNSFIHYFINSWLLFSRQLVMKSLVQFKFGLDGQSGATYLWRFNIFPYDEFQLNFIENQLLSYWNERRRHGKQ